LAEALRTDPKVARREHKGNYNHNLIKVMPVFCFPATTLINPILAAIRLSIERVTIAGAHALTDLLCAAREHRAV